MGFLRITTNPRIFPKPFSTSEALEMVGRLLKSSGTIILQPGLEHFSLLKRIVAESAVGGAMLMDAHLAALAIEHGATLASNDRDFRRFDGLKLINPLVKSTE